MYHLPDCFYEINLLSVSLRLILALLFAWKIVLPAVVIALFFDCRYSFSGKDDLSPANKAMDKASEVAEKVKSEFESR